MQLAIIPSLTLDKITDGANFCQRSPTDGGSPTSARRDHSLNFVGLSPGGDEAGSPDSPGDHDFFRFFPVFPLLFGRAPWIPGVQTLKMGEKWEMFKMGKKRDSDPSEDGS